MQLFSNAACIIACCAAALGTVAASCQNSTDIFVEKEMATATVDTTQRLAELRELMKKFAVDVYIIPSEDSHNSEYVAPCDARREFISGFSGSAGTAVVTQDKAALSTDGRYFNQAERQLDANWILLKQGLPDVRSWQEWALEQVAPGARIGIDPTVITTTDARMILERLKWRGVKFEPVVTNLVDTVWGDRRPTRPSEAVTVHPVQFAGKDVKTKLEELRKELDKKKRSGLVISMLDEIAWLFNLRGSDIAFNPVFYAYAAVTPASAILYIDSTKLSSEIKTYLSDSGVSVRPYDKIFEDTQAFGQALVSSPSTEQPGINVKKFLLSNKGSWALKDSLGGDAYVEEIRSPVADAKAVKNSTELEGFRSCHIRDGAAIVEYFAWLQKELTAGTRITEVEGADKLEELRKQQKNFVGLSFPTISSTGANAAIIHYQPERRNCSVIDINEVYLCDSGGQYVDGTTDTTRTLHFGNATEMEKKAYTLVLKGQIALDLAIFPRGTSGFALDVLARQFLWAEGLDYRHGTGHGVGSYLNVHEGPIGIGTRVAYAEIPLSVGHVISNEPGYYEDGKFGIRLENIIMVKEVATTHQFGGKPYQGYEHVTVVPYCRNLINETLLTKIEKDWLNEYHARVRAAMADYFEAGSDTMKWVERETAPY